MPFQKGRALRLVIKAQVTSLYGAIWQIPHFISYSLNFYSVLVTVVVFGNSETEQDIQIITAKIGKFSEGYFMPEE